MKKLLFMLLLATTLFSCKERFSEGERVGTVIKFSQAGVIWDSWDGELNLTQTGMNTSGAPFYFSFDNDRSDQQALIDTMVEAQRCGWKIKIIYHQVWGIKNVWNNRGESDYFVDNIEVLDKDFAKPLGNIKQDFPLGSKDNPMYIKLIE